MFALHNALIVTTKIVEPYKKKDIPCHKGECHITHTHVIHCDMPGYFYLEQKDK